MKPMSDRTQFGQPQPTLSPAPRKLFRIEKIEERIAPKGIFGHYNPKTKCVGRLPCD